MFKVRFGKIKLVLVLISIGLLTVLTEALGAQTIAVAPQRNELTQRADTNEFLNQDPAQNGKRI